MKNNIQIWVKGIAITFICLVMNISFSGCYYDKSELLYPQLGSVDCSTINAKFAADVNPLIQNKCNTAGCHDAGGSAGGTVLETYTQISANAAGIYQRCVVDKTMPVGTPLNDSEISIIKCWINSGTPNN